jgi:hypothetical protein
MAQFNEIDEGGLNSILVRRLAMKTGTAAPTIAPEIMPDLTLESDRPEWGFLKGEMLCSGAFEQLLVAGTFSVLTIRNPTGSGILTTISRIQNTGTAAFRVVRIAFGTEAMTTTAYAGVQDLRFRFRTMSTQTATSTPAAVANQGVFAILDTGFRVFPEYLVLPPGSAVQLQAITLATDLKAEVSWYERPVQSGELV